MLLGNDGTRNDFVLRSLHNKKEERTCKDIASSKPKTTSTAG
jgi:hypothetical protein